MCGLIGVISDFQNGFSLDQMDILGESIIINQFRGVDSTGVFVVDKDSNSYLHKVVGDAKALFSSNEWDDVKEKVYHQGKIVIGHGRAATRGIVTVENAHPFAKTYESGEVLKLVHNGTLELLQDLPDFDKFTVDSEWIAEMMVRYGPEEALSKIRGAMALIWWDGKEKTLNFFRNNDRPLHFGQFAGVGTGETIIINSEAAGVEYMAARHKLKTTDPKGVTCFYFAPYKHYVLPFDDLMGGFSKILTVTPPKDLPKVHSFPYHRREYYTRTEWGQDGRSYESDIRKIMTGEYKSVRWVCKDSTKGIWQRITKYHDDAERYEYSTPGSSDVSPYYSNLEYLRLGEICAFGRPDVMEPCVVAHYTSEHNREGWDTRVRFYSNLVPFVPPQKAFEEASEEEKKEKAPETFVDIGIRKFRPNRRIKWATHSRFTKQQLKHKAIVEAKGGASFLHYENSCDGSFDIGDNLVVEINDVIPYGGNSKLLEARGFRLRPEGGSDDAVEVSFFTGEPAVLERLSDLNTNPFYTGTIAAIVLARKSRWEDDGVVVNVILTDVSPMTWDDALLNVDKKTDARPSC